MKSFIAVKNQHLHCTTTRKHLEGGTNIYTTLKLSRGSWIIDAAEYYSLGRWMTMKGSTNKTPNEAEHITYHVDIYSEQIIC